MKRALTTTLIIAVLVSSSAGCARLRSSVRLRVEPTERPRTEKVEIGQGLQLRARRDGDALLVQARAVRYCQKLIKQRALGFKVVETRAVGHGLVYQWVMGSLITASGAGLMVYNGMTPALPSDQIDYKTRGWLYSGFITAVGAALLTGSVFQQRSLGVSETPLGERTLTKKGDIFSCKSAPATAGKLRLTLDIGETLKAEVGADGTARFPISPELQQRINAGSRRGTLEALGDWRSQVRVRL